MRLIWKGKLTPESAFVYPNLPKTSKPLFNPQYAWSMYLLILPVLAVAYAAIRIRLPHAEGILFSRPALLIGIVLALVFLPIHEGIHALCFPKGTMVYAYYTSVGISLIPTCKLRKIRYLFVLLTPNFILGILPLFVWTFCPGIGAMMGSILFSFSVSCLAMGVGDIYNVILVIMKMPKNSYLVTSGMNCYIITN